MHELSKRAFALAAGVLMAGGIVALTAGPAAAAVTPTCKTAVTTLTDRADSGLHGDWAKDAITRTVKLCEAAPVALGATTATPAKSTYTATVTDTGTFTTVAGKSPVKGATLPAGIKGSLTGGYTATFTAEASFVKYAHVFDGKTYSGTAPSTTGDWVAKLWGGTDFTSVTNLVGWKWTYWTCSADLAKATETFVNAEAANAGDITGKACPSVAPSASAPAPSAPAVVIPSTSPAAGAGGGLPVTGFPVWTAVAGGVVLVGAGGVLLVAAKRRKGESFSA